MDETQSTWLNDGLVLAFVLSALVFGLPLLVIVGAVFAAYYGVGTVSWKLLVAVIGALVVLGDWFAVRRWVRRGGWKVAGVGAVPLAVFGGLGLALWLVPGLLGMGADSVGVAPSIIGIVGMSGLVAHLLLSWVAIATAPATGAGSARASKPPKPSNRDRQRDA